MDTLRLYIIFHLNLAYSAIDTGQRGEVLHNCYWPLLDLVDRHDIPAGVELSGYTLDAIDELDPAWVRRFRNLLAVGRCELVGSGYAQIIGPLAPSAVNQKNLELGNQVSGIAGDPSGSGPDQ